MAFQHIFTSAQYGVRAGSTGYCTVAHTAGMPEDLITGLEQLSRYDHPAGSDPSLGGVNPVIFRFQFLTVNTGTYFVMSRLSDAGADFTGRTNYLAQHLALTSTDVSTMQQVPGINPATLLSIKDETLWRTTWAEAPQQLNPLPEGWLQQQAKSEITEPPVRGWGNYGTRQEMAPALLEAPRQQKCFLSVPPSYETTLLFLLNETLRLAVETENVATGGNSPQEAWRYTFTTFLQPGEVDTEYAWCAVSGDKSYQHAVSLGQQPIDVFGGQMPPATNPRLLHFALHGKAPQVEQETTHDDIPAETEARSAAPTADDDDTYNQIMAAGNKPKPKKMSKLQAPSISGKGKGEDQEQPAYLQKALAGITPGPIPEHLKVGYRRPVLPTKPKTNPKRLIRAVAALLVVAAGVYIYLTKPTKKDPSKPDEDDKTAESGGGSEADKAKAEAAAKAKAKAEAAKAEAAKAEAEAAKAKAKAEADKAAAANNKAPAELAGQLEKLFGKTGKVQLWLDGPTAPPQRGPNAGLVTTKIPKQKLPILAKLAGGDGKDFIGSIDLDKCEYYIGGSTLDPKWVKMDPSGNGGLDGRLQLNFFVGGVGVPKEKAIVVSLKKNLRSKQEELHISYPPAAGPQILALHMVDKDGTEERLYILKASKANEGDYVFFSGLPGWGRKNGNEIVELYPEWVELFGQNGRVKVGRPDLILSANMTTQLMDGKWYSIEVSFAGLELQEKNALTKLANTPLLPPGNAAGDQGGMVRFTKIGNPPVLTFKFPKPPGAEKLVIIDQGRTYGFTKYLEDKNEKGGLVAAEGENNLPLHETRPLAAGTKKITIKLQLNGNNQDPNFRYFWKLNAEKEKEKAKKRAEALRKAIATRKTDIKKIEDAYKVEKTKLRSKFKDHENYFGLFVQSPTSIFITPIIKFSPPK
jgi:hypothetical protein